MRGAMLSAAALAAVLALGACSRGSSDEPNQTAEAPNMVETNEIEPTVAPPAARPTNTVVISNATAPAQIDEDAAAVGMTARRSTSSTTTTSSTSSTSGTPTTSTP